MGGGRLGWGSAAEEAGQGKAATKQRQWAGMTRRGRVTPRRGQARAGDAGEGADWGGATIEGKRGWARRRQPIGQSGAGAG